MSVIANRIKNNQVRPAERLIKDALNLARELYSNPKLRVSDVRQTKLIDLKNITSRFQANIRLYEPMNQLAWRLVFGKALGSSIASSVASNIDISLYESIASILRS